MKQMAQGFTQGHGPQAGGGRWVSDQEMARWLGLHVGTLRNWRSLDKRDGRRRGGLIYRKFGGSVRYWLSEELLDPAAAGVRAAGAVGEGERP